METMWSYRSALAVAEASRVVSDSGESLSPKWEPEIIAPAAKGRGTPMPAATPMSATPTVAAVPQQAPVAREVMEQMMKARGRNIWGLMSLMP